MEVVVNKDKTKENTSKEIYELVMEAMNSKVSKQEFKEFLQSKRKELAENKTNAQS